MGNRQLKRLLIIDYFLFLTIPNNTNENEIINN
jgi:hypothetical protein